MKKEIHHLQNKIYQKMSAARKIEIASQLFLLGKKLDNLKKQDYGAKNYQRYHSRKIIMQDC